MRTQNRMSLHASSRIACIAGTLTSTAGGRRGLLFAPNNDAGFVGQPLFNAVAIRRVDRTIDQTSMPDLKGNVRPPPHGHETLEPPKKKALNRRVISGVNPIATAAFPNIRKPPSDDLSILPTFWFRRTYGLRTSLHVVHRYTG